MTTPKKMIVPLATLRMIDRLAKAQVKQGGQPVSYGEETDNESEISGPWDNEPNEVMLEHAGYVCELKRHPTMGNWCGYVYVGDKHPLFKHLSQDDTYDFLDVHGGVTYMGEGKFGFDCGHAGDFSPNLSFGTSGAEEYRTVEYATDEVKRLAQQLRNYDTAYHRKMFDVAKKLESRAQSIRGALSNKRKQ